MYTPAATKKWEKKVALTAERLLRDNRSFDRLDGNLRIYILQVFKRPKAKSRAKDPDGRIWHNVTPDIDNVVKATLDALKHLWKDDCIITQLISEKVYGAKGEDEHLVIKIESAEIHHDQTAKTWIEYQEPAQLDFFQGVLPSRPRTPLERVARKKTRKGTKKKLSIL